MSSLEDLLKEGPTLTLDPLQTKEEVALVVESKEEKPVVEEISLTEDEKKMVEQFAKQINLSDSNQILQYGAGSQRKMVDFSETALGHVKNKDLGEVGKMLTDVVTELKNFELDEEEKGKLFGFFKKTGNKITALKAKYAKAETNVTEICNVLEKHQMQLLKDVAVLDQLYELNKNYFKELTMYILAGKQKLAKVQQEELPALVERANQTGAPEDAQAVNDLTALCNRFEKKVHDLELTRMISIQMAPQIRLVQNNDTLMSEKIQSTLVNTIPLWKNQMVLALGIAHSEEAMRAQREVTDMTNLLLKKNADALKQSTIATAHESERGVVELETLRYTNESLISTLDEVLNIQTEGKRKRMEAEAELVKIESELKTKLLQYAK